MRFLVDQAVSWRVARDLAAEGHDAVHVRDLGLAAADDATILRRAADEERVIITQDTDFGTLLAGSFDAQPSVIILRMHNGRPEEHTSALLANLDELDDDLVRGAIVVIGDTAIRVRRLPVTRRE